MKKIISFLIALIMIFAAFSAAISVSATIYSGTCGENLTWEYDNETGVLTISGEGNMYDYPGSKPWSESIKSVCICDGVTSIGEFAFFACSKLTNVTISNSVTSIGERAFFSCSSLTDIIIPDSVTSMGECAFAYCENLVNVKLSDNLTSISDQTFSFCNSLASITIPEGIKSIGWNAFFDCKSLKNITIPDSVTSIDDAFGFCYSLEYNTFENGSYLGNEGNPYFALIEARSYNLTSCRLNDNTKIIAGGALRDYPNLTSVTITNSVKKIGGYAFYNSKCLSDIYYVGTEEEWKAYNCFPANVTIHFVETNTTTATCEKDGIIVYTCSECGYTFSEILPGGHKEVETRIEATCTKDGMYIISCKVCGEVFEADTIPATGHEVVSSPGIAPTCTEDGFTESSECSVCGLTITEKKRIPALGHTPFEERSEATCTETGSIITHCSVCGEVLSEVITDPLGHCVSRTEIAATCTESGMYIEKCTRCGKTFGAGTIPALGHDFALDFTVDVEPTETAPGSKSRHCLRCDAVTDVTEIPPQKPVFVLGDVNGDGKITIKDVLVLRKYLAGIEKIDPEMLKYSDFNRDGKVTIKDVLKLRKYLANIEGL